MPDYQTSINTTSFSFTSFSNNASYTYSMGTEPGGTEVAQVYVSALRTLAVGIGGCGVGSQQSYFTAPATGPEALLPVPTRDYAMI